MVDDKKKQSSSDRRMDDIIGGTKRSVSFCNTVSLKRFTRYNEEELHAAWYNRAELRTILVDIKRTLKAMETGKLKSNKFCSRGLETLTPNGHLMRQKFRHKGWSIVFSEQEFQHEVSCSDPQLISSLYRDAAQDAATIARKFALIDQAVVRKLIFNQERFQGGRELKLESGSCQLSGLRQQVLL